MSIGLYRRGILRTEPVDLLICLTSFALVLWVYAGLMDMADRAWPASRVFGLMAAVITSWFALISLDHRQTIGMNRLLEHLLYAMGLGLTVQFALAYVAGIRAIPLVVLAAGCLLSTGAALPARRLICRVGPSRHCEALLVGFDPAIQLLVHSPKLPVVGVLNNEFDRTPPGVSRLGSPDQLVHTVAVTHPGQIIVGDRDGHTRISPRTLLDLRYSGNSITDAGELYEQTFRRICWWRMRPLEALFATAGKISPVGVTIQAIYTNLIGLALLLLSLPILIVIGTSLKVLSGGGAVLEQVECPGFQRTPFHLLRFRNRRAKWIGYVLSKTHLAGLPQLINVVRGEMAVFGPPPVRTEFAERLEQLIPAYAYRFLAKPGLLGWSQLYLQKSGAQEDEGLRLEYDLYYVKNAGVPLDLEILLKSVVRPFSLREDWIQYVTSRDKPWDL
jgi:lipopolysaccharide/colanic/teichoic acid biosynthesis glycosyltransferase